MARRATFGPASLPAGAGTSAFTGVCYETDHQLPLLPGDVAHDAGVARVEDRRAGRIGGADRDDLLRPRALDARLGLVDRARDRARHLELRDARRRVGGDLLGAVAV